MIRTLALAFACFATAVSAQVVSTRDLPSAPDLSDYAKTTDLTAQIAAAKALIPSPASTVPPTEAIGGTIGTGGTYRPADSAAPRITRAGMVTTDTAGAWAITWATALLAIPVVLPIPINTSVQPIVCNVATRTTTGATGRCWYARTLPSTLTLLSALVSYDVFGATASGIQVQALAIPPTQ